MKEILGFSSDPHHLENSQNVKLAVGLGEPETRWF